jgi:zinc ribbon protein
MFCPKCGADNPDEARFCGSCATRLPSAADAATTPPVDPEPQATARPATARPGTTAWNAPGPAAPAGPAGAQMQPAAGAAPPAWNPPAPAPPVGFLGQAAPAAPPVSGWHNPGLQAGAASGSAEEVTTAMNVGVIVGSLILPLIGLIMGGIYLMDASPAKKKAGRTWLIVGVGAAVFWVLVLASY